MAYFYGWTHDQILSLDVENFNSYWLAIPIIEAQTSIGRLAEIDWPNQPQSFRESRHRQLFQIAYTDTFSADKKQEPVTALAKLLKG